MGKLFGTDGIRGVVNDGLDAMLAFRVGMAAAQVMTREKGGGQPRFTIGKDTRISSDLLEGALIAGLCSAGADVLHLGVKISEATAKQTALSRVPGATAANIYKFKLDFDDGRWEYEGEIRYGTMEYEFTIDATTGNIIEWDADSIYD